MYFRFTPRGWGVGKVIGKTGAWTAGVLLVVKGLAVVCHAIGSACSSSPRVESTPRTYTPPQNWAASYIPPSVTPR